MDERLAENLRRFGLSEKEVETYLTVLSHGAVTASSVAEATDISRSYVYDVCEDLASRGFVEIRDHVTPTKIVARPPDDVVGELKQDLDAMCPRLEAQRSSVQESIDRITVLGSRDTVLKHFREFIADAEFEVNVSLPAWMLAHLESELREATERGVLVLVLVHAPTGELPVDDLDGLGSVVRKRTYGMPVQLIVDYDEVGIVVPEGMVSRADTDLEALEIRDVDLFYPLIAAFKAQEWLLGEEISLGDPMPLPATLENFSHVTVQTALHDLAGQLPDVTFEGREISFSVDQHNRFRRKSLPWETFTGTIVGTRQRLVEPRTNTNPIENALEVRLDGEDELVTVGGHHARWEDYETRRVTLEPPDD